MSNLLKVQINIIIIIIILIVIRDQENKVIF